MRIQDRKILQRVFTTPAPTDIRWDDIEAMLHRTGVQVQERSGTRIALAKNGEVMVVRRPHPKPVTVRATVRDIAAFLKTVGVKP